VYLGVEREMGIFSDFYYYFLMRGEGWMHCTETIVILFSSGLSVPYGTNIPHQCFSPVIGHYGKSKKRSVLMGANLCSATDLSCVPMAHLIIASFYFSRI